MRRFLHGLGFFMLFTPMIIILAGMIYTNPDILIALGIGVFMIIGLILIMIYGD
jgi:hypothetical protein